MTAQTRTDSSAALFEARPLRALCGQVNEAGPENAAFAEVSLLRAAGHLDFIEPSRLALSIPGDDGGVGRIVRTTPEFGSRWREVRFHDLSMPGNRAASVAVLA